MKKYLLLYKILFLGLPTFAQITISPGAQWINSGNVTTTVNDMNLINNGSFSAGNSIFRFTGNAVSNVGGSSTITFYQLEISKTGTNQLVLLSDVNVNNQVNFISGLLDLNQKELNLSANAILNNENENSRIVASNGGEVMITTNLNAPNGINAGNLGAVITSGANLGSVTIARGHIQQSGTGLTGSVLRYYTITPQNNSGLNATLRFNYFDAEKNGKDETNFVVFQSDDNGINWTNQLQSSISPASNFVEKTGLGNLSRFTLSDNVVVSDCSATGVVLSVKGGKQNTVNVNWSTATETGNQGFGVERRLKNEPDFSQLSFVNSKAAGGNSVSQLNYSYLDNNSYSDTSYYRLKIVGLNASVCYSDIRTFIPKGKKGPGNNNVINTDTVQTLAINKEVNNKLPVIAAQLSVGPNPNNGNFWFKLTGIEKAAMGAIYTIDGKLLKQIRVNNLEQQQVKGLKTGIYILKIEGVQPFKVIVQNDGGSTSNFSVTNSIPSKS